MNCSKQRSIAYHPTLNLLWEKPAFVLQAM